MRAGHGRWLAAKRPRPAWPIPNRTWAQASAFLAATSGGSGPLDGAADIKQFFPCQVADVVGEGLAQPNEEIGFVPDLFKGVS